MHSSLARQAPIGIFDSGIGGLSVLRAMQQRMPHERFIYIADSGNAPYGEKSNSAILQRSQAVANFLRHAHECKALVIACNTATAAAANELRTEHNGWPIIGIEPAIKPAAQQSQSGCIGVWATRSTLNSEKYKQLRQRTEAAHPNLQLQDTPCDGLASAIETLAIAPHACSSELHALVAKYAETLTSNTDTLVLGCTHYPLIAQLIAKHLPPHVALIDPGNRVAERIFNVLQSANLLASSSSNPAQALSLWSSGDTQALAQATQRWLNSEITLVQALCV